MRWRNHRLSLHSTAITVGPNVELFVVIRTASVAKNPWTFSINSGSRGILLLLLFTINRTFLQNLSIMLILNMGGMMQVWQALHIALQLRRSHLQGTTSMTTHDYKYQLYRIYLITLNKCRRSSAWESTRPEHSGVKLKTELSWAQISPTAYLPNRVTLKDKE